MRVLVAIAYYGTTNEPFVKQLIDEYRSMRHDVDLVVLSEAPKELGEVEVRVGLPSPNPYSLPFAHKPLFDERRDDYDLYIYTEDDTLITERSIDAFLWATGLLPPSTIAGFLRTEEAADGTLRCSSVNSRFHWRPDSGVVVDDEVFAEYTNPHGAAFMLTRDQLHRAIASGGFLTAPREGRLSMRVTAATDPYTGCGFTKLICVSRLDDFLLPHLTNRYSATDIGTSLDEFRDQAAMMRRIAVGELSADRLLCPTSRLDDARWDKLFWAPVDHAALSAVPSGAHSALSFGVGSGATEAALISRGAEVAGIPLDRVIATSASRRGVDTTPPDLRAALSSLAGRRFDVLLLSNSLHHVPDPANLLRELRGSVEVGGTVVATLPNVRREILRWLLRRTPRPPRHPDFEQAGVHLESGRSAAAWFRRAGLEDVRVSYPGDRARLLRRWLTSEVVVRGRVPRQPAEREPTVRRPLVSVGVPVYNGGNYLRHALESIRSQDLVDIEVIICDNASTDDTAAICQEFVDADPRFRYVRHEHNLGAARNYNECFFRSSGEFFTWLAHDDMRAPGFLSRCVRAFDDEGATAVLVYPRADFVDESGTPRAHDESVVEARSSSPHRRLAVAVADTGAVNPVFGLIRSAALEQTRLIGPFVASDRVLLAELALLGQIHEVPETLSFRRLHAEMSTNANPGKAERTAWFDPDAPTPRLNEVALLGVEFSRSVVRLPLAPGDRAACLVTVPVRMISRRGRIALGAWRRAVTSRLRS